MLGMGYSQGRSSERGVHFDKPAPSALLWDSVDEFKNAGRERWSGRAKHGGRHEGHRVIPGVETWWHEE